MKNFFHKIILGFYTIFQILKKSLIFPFLAVRTVIKQLTQNSKETTSLLAMALVILAIPFLLAYIFATQALTIIVFTIFLIYLTMSFVVCYIITEYSTEEERENPIFHLMLLAATFYWPITIIFILIKYIKSRRKK